MSTRIETIVPLHVAAQIYRASNDFSSFKKSQNNNPLHDYAFESMHSAELLQGAPSYQACMHPFEECSTLQSRFADFKNGEVSVTLSHRDTQSDFQVVICGSTDQVNEWVCFVNERLDQPLLLEPATEGTEPRV
ncbi:MAG: hypothetical protein AAGJ35_10640 [Myxococcota bacterium]